MNKVKRYFDFNKENRNGVFLLISILLLIQIGILCYNPIISEKKTTKSQLVQIKSLQQKLENTLEPKIVYKKIDPNKLNKKDWMTLGFSEKQATIILKYRKSLGSFSNLEEIKQCYVISSNKFKELKPFIFFSNNSKQENYQKIIPKLSYFDPNELSKERWVALGFSQKQAIIILKYKNSLGTFSTLEEIKQCYVISNDKFEELKPYIIFSNSKKQYHHRKILKLTYFNPNEFSKQDWKSLGFSQKQVEVILKYKKSLGGIFKTKEELKNCFVISDEIFQEIEPWIIFDEQKKKDETEVINKELNRCNENSLIIQGITSKEARRIINYRNSLGGFYDWNQLKEIGVSSNKIKELETQLTLILSVKRMNVNEEELYILKKHPYITQDFVNFLKNSRENLVKFSSFQEIQNQYKKEQLNKLLEYYLSY